MTLYFIFAGFIVATVVFSYIVHRVTNQLVSELRNQVKELNEERKLWVNKALVRDHQGRIFVDNHAPVSHADIIHQQEIIQQQDKQKNLLKADEMLPPYTAAIQSWIAEDEKAKQQKFQIAEATKEDILAGLDEIEASNGNH